MMVTHRFIANKRSHKQHGGENHRRVKKGRRGLKINTLMGIVFNYTSVAFHSESTKPNLLLEKVL